MNGIESQLPKASIDLSFFVTATWNTQSPKWIELDREIAPDHPVRRIARLVDEELNLEALLASYSGRGSQPHRPDLLVKLAIYEHSRGQPQPTQWFEDLCENKPVQWLCFAIRPSLTSLYEFRDRMEAFHELFNQQVIRTAMREEHTEARCGSLDGTTMEANASRHRSLNLDNVEKRIAILEAEIATCDQPPLATSETVQPQPSEVGQPPPSAVAVPSPPGTTGPGTPKQSWRAKTLRGHKRQFVNYCRARHVLKSKHAANVRRRKDKRKKHDKIRVSLGDPQAPWGLDKQKTYRPLYNCQLMSDVATDLVLSYATTPTVVDAGQLVPMLDRTKAMTGRELDEALVDAGYPSGDELAECKKRGVEVYSPWNENAFTKTKQEQSADKNQQRAHVQFGLTVLAHNLTTLDKLRNKKQLHAQNTGKTGA